MFALQIATNSRYLFIPSEELVPYLIIEFNMAVCMILRN